MNDGAQGGGNMAPDEATAGAAGATVLVAEDDEASRLALARSLERHGYRVLEASNGEEALSVFNSTAVDLCVLDVGMPRLDGFAVLQQLRLTSDVPVIFLTGRAEEVDRVVGLELGADDYVLKPYSLRELVARVRARLRRPAVRETEVPSDEVISYGPLHIDVRAHEVEVDGQRVELTTREYELLSFLARHPRQVFTREQLLEAVWGTRYQDPATVTEHVRRVRVKISDGTTPDKAWLTTLRGTGYRFDP